MILPSTFTSDVKQGGITEVRTPVNTGAFKLLVGGLVMIRPGGSITGNVEVVQGRGAVLDLSKAVQ